MEPDRPSSDQWPEGFESEGWRKDAKIWWAQAFANLADLERFVTHTKMCGPLLRPVAEKPLDR